MGWTLSQYIFSCRSKLHDLNGNFWTDSLLTQFITEARKKVLFESGYTRAQILVPIEQQNITFSVLVSPVLGSPLNITPPVQVQAGQERVWLGNISSLVSAQSITDVDHAAVLWGNVKYPLNYLTFPELNSVLRPLQNFQIIPVAYTFIPETQIIIVAPVPSLNMNLEVDIVFEPQDALPSGADYINSFDLIQAIVHLACAYAKSYEGRTQEEIKFFGQHDYYLAKYAEHWGGQVRQRNPYARVPFPRI